MILHRLLLAATFPARYALCWHRDFQLRAASITYREGPR